MAIKRHPWEKVRDHYVEHPEEITLKELSEAYDIPYQSVRDRSSEEKWKFQRAAYQSEVHAKQTANRMKRMVEQANNFDDQSLRAAQIGQGLVAGRMAQIAELFAAGNHHHKVAAEKLKQGLPVERSELYSFINYKELGELAAALQRFQEVGRKALGTDIQRFDVQGEVQHNIEAHISIVQEMARDDVDRQAQLLEAMHRAGLISLEIEEADVEDAEVVGDGDGENYHRRHDGDPRD